MNPVSNIPKNIVARVKFLLSDVDDTITRNGMLPSESMATMEKLQNKGIKIVLVTGRPAGWCDHIARMWPVNAVVGENGALYFAYDRKEKRMHKVLAKSEEDFAIDRHKLEVIKKEILQKVPRAKFASDQNYRLADLAVDICEDISPLSKSEITDIVRIFEVNGATSKVSSIHVNGWFGSFDKCSMTRKCLADRFNFHLSEQDMNVMYIGDSPNDEPMFSAVRLSVGVANINNYKLNTPPKWITKGYNADGFIELGKVLLNNVS